MKMFMLIVDESYFGVGFKLLYNEFLIWVVFFNFYKMVLFLWERGDENFVKVFVVGKLFKVFVEEMVKEELKVDIIEEFEIYLWYVYMFFK